MAADAAAPRVEAWGSYRLQLALGAGRDRGVHARARGGRERGPRPARRRPPPRRRRAAPHLPGGECGRRRAHGARPARRRRPARHDSRRGPPVRAHRRLLRALPVTGALPGHPTVLVDRRRRADGLLRRLAAPARLRLDRRARPPVERRAAAPCSPTSSTTARCATRCASRSAGCSARRCSSCRSCARCTTATPTWPRSRADAAALAASDGAPGPLASAMLALGATPAGGVVGISPERVDVLLGAAAGRGGCRGCCWSRPSPRSPRSSRSSWRASGSASVQATLNLPIASSQPCVLVLALVPVLVCLAAAVARRDALAPGRAAPRPDRGIRPARRSRIARLDVIYYSM